MQIIISSHLLCGVSAVACAVAVVVRAARDYREYHPRTQTDKANSAATRIFWPCKTKQVPLPISSSLRRA